jgi:hypothetical protein
VPEPPGRAGGSEHGPERFLPFPVPPAQLGLANLVRTTLIATSLQSLRTRDLLGAYASRLQGPHRDTILSTVAGSWLSVDAAAAHYRACDALALPIAEQLAMGMDVGDRVHGTFLGVMVRSARTAGVTPWAALARSGTLYARLFAGGGGMAVSKLGPKDARIDLIGNPLCEIDYFRVGVRGVYQAAVQLFCSRVYSSDASVSRTARSMSIRLSWV